jgi:hypothetical protein
MSEKLENTNFDEIQHQAHRTNYTDGFPGIFLGIILLITAVVINLGGVFMVLFFISFVLCFPISELLRKKFTYPRLGYFRVKSDSPRKVLSGMTIFIIFLTVCSLIIIILLQGESFTSIDAIFWIYLPVIVGLTMFGLSIDISDKTGQRKFLGLGISSILLGFLFILLNFPHPKVGISIYLLILGSFIFVVGLITFFRFIKLYPVISEDEVPETGERDENEVE